MKRILALLLAFVMTMPMVACKSNNGGEVVQAPITAPSEEMITPLLEDAWINWFFPT